MADEPNTIDPQLHAALRAHEAGRLSEAEAGYLARLAQHREDAVALLYLGVLRYDTRELDEAIRLISRSIELEPRRHSAYNHLGLALLARNELDDAASQFHQALRLQPGHPDALNNLANTYKRMKRFDEAERTFGQLLATHQGHLEARYNLGLLQFERRRYEEASRQFDEVLQLAPAFHRAHHQLALVAESLGRFEDADRHYRRVLEIVPEHPAALAGLMALRSHPVDAALVAKAGALAAREDLPDPDSYVLPYALAKRLEAQGDYDRAFELLKLANTRRGRSVRYDPQRVETYFREITSTFSRAFVRRHAPAGSDSQRPVFVIGMPRTGTTLTEQILGAHPQAYGAGELEDIPRLVSRLPAVMQQALGIGVAPYPACLEHLNPDFMRAMTGYYLTILQRQSADAARVVDKHPFNFLHAGLIAALFPRARIIHCTRHPLDVAISCYAETFELRQDFSTDFGRFAHYYGCYERLMRHWRATLDQPMLEVRYEALVAEPERRAREIVRFCGLEWDDACLAFQQTGKPVHTPSRWQVRQPIYASSVERSKRFEAHLAPLREALAAYGIVPGDGA